MWRKTECSLKANTVEKKSLTDLSILWRRLDQPGHESARLFFQHPDWHLTGTAVFAHHQQPCRLDYLVVCDSGWQTLSGKVAGWVGSETVELELSVDSARRWRLNGTERPEVAGCIDLDLNFSPSTNLLPIRRLGLAIGQEANVAAAWLRFPSFALEPLEQLYRRTDAATYRYESAGGQFVTELQVNTAGFVTYYPNFWQIEEVV
ncbi:MAG TPA: putative glycolipid-binding domain-containing protein [Anaerolineae bacterium]|nr:putative glycolipid-binding domain-containing protein [Anaerolineae bacterium]